MYERINEPDDLDWLRVGDLLVQYPLSGEPAEVIDLSIPEDFALYQIMSIGPIKLRLLLCQDITEIPQPQSPASDEQTAIGLTMFIEKNTGKMIQEKTWWLRRKENPQG